MKNKKVPVTVIKRLPRYHRYLGELLSKGITRISSAKLSELMRVTASQIRQDLNNFGVFGQQGYGYNVELLYNEISNILGAKEGYKAIIIGIGNLGRTIAANINFKKRGVELIGAFDNNPDKIGTKINNLEIKDINDAFAFVKKYKPQIAILTTPKDVAAELAQKLYEAGIKGFWNFSNMELSGSNDYKIENVHIGDSLMTLCYAIKNVDQEEIL